jgi:amino acid adenylation domain-containing protein
MLIISGYGPSETTNICTVRPSVSPLDLINNIGRPFDNTSAFVLDPNNDTILPRGAVGELCFGGYQVFRGYLNRPDLTAAKIINHPRYGRIYRSGDLGVLLPDDSILSTGRLDDQVKIRGQRVELGEISSAILDQQAVRDCATVILQDSRDSELLVTFWVPARGDDTDFKVLEAQNLRSDILSIFAALSPLLPSYMVPSHLVPISLLPMTAQGKIDKRKLQRCFIDLTAEVKESVAASYGAPNGADSLDTLWEHQVAETLAETLCLPVESIMRNSSFFNFGLDSVSAISLSNRLRGRGLGDFGISTILKNPTIAHLQRLAEACSSVNHSPNGTKSNIEETLDPDTIAHVRDMFKERGGLISKILPCTPLQEAMLSAGESTADSSYSNVMVFYIEGDVTRLQQSWASMIQRHEILRTSFVATNDPSHAFVQVVMDAAELAWTDIAWTGKTFQDAHNMVDDLLRVSKPPVWLAIARSESLTRLLFCCHHAVYDGIAIETLLKEVQEIYHRRELPPQVCFDVYLQQMLSQDQPGSDLFWEGMFQDFEPTSFPDLTITARKGQSISSSWHHPLSLPLSRIREACQDTSVTLLSIIHATWAKLLHFYTGESDICFGNVVSGRALPGHGLERLVAPCFNTLPVRINFDFRDENVALARQAHALNIESLAFQLTPLRRIQNIALKEGGQLFDTLVILQQPSEPLDGTIWTLEEDDGIMDLPLVCEISQNEIEDRVDLILHYHSTIVSRAEAALMAETFEACLKNIVEQPDVPAHDTHQFPQRLRAESDPNIEIAAIEAHFMHSGFEHVADTTPDRIAIDFLHADGEKTTWSFQTLNEKANHIAHALILFGVKPEDIIPVHILKTPLFYASILGILKAGAAFAPVHPGLPDARKRLMIADLGAKYVLHTKDSLLSSIDDGVTLIDVDALKYAAIENPIVADLSSSNVAYCIFTSGSTGVPKAVSVEHRAPIQTIECSKSIVPWTPSSRLLQYAAPTFDMCYYDCFLAWTLGFTLCAADQEMMLNDLPKIINVLEVDLLDLTPSVAASLARSEVPNVKWLYCIGEAMTPSIVKDWAGACVNSYGPSEAAFCTTIYPVSNDVKSSVIGKPFPSTRFAVFSTHGNNPLPPLSKGELYIGGAQLARGYHSRLDLTNDKFVVNSGQRFYRSGDVVRQLSDGNFEFIGRTDDQIKIRGLRVELGEINNTLRESHADIESAVTQIMKKDADAKEQLVTFLVTNRSVDVGEHEDLRRFLRQAAKDRLPSYMVPHFLIFVDRIPRSLAGKVDKKALTEIFHLLADANTPNGTSSNTSQHQWTALESRVRNVLAHLSKSTIGDVSPTTTIYQLGLDSISAVQVAAALRKDGHNVKASDVMRHLTCVDIAGFVDRGAVSDLTNAVQFDFEAFDKSHRQEVLASCRINNEDVTAIRPCTPLQAGMVSQMLAKDGTVYINYLRLELDCGLDLIRLEEAWREVVASHQMLRTGFAHLKDKHHPFGMIEYTPHAVTLPFDRSSGQHTSETDVWLEELKYAMAAEIHHPPWHVRIVREEGCNYLDLVMFHALFDAQSLHFIFRDVIRAYRGQKNEPPSANLTSVIDEIFQRSKGYSEETKEFWTRMGRSSAPCRFPNLTPLRYESRSPTIRTHVSRRSLSEIESACQRSNTTLQAVGIASWLSLVSVYTGEPTPTCGIVLSGRDFEAAERAIFPCINTVPFSHDMTTDTKDILGKITELLGQIQQYQHIPLNETQRLMGHPNDALFDTIFAYQKLPSQDNVDGLWTVLDEKATIEYPLSIELEPKGAHLEYRLTFMPHVIPWQQAKLMLEQLDHLMERFVCFENHNTTFNPSFYSITPAKQLKLTSEAQLLHDFVELTAEQHPERVALEFANSIHTGDHSAQRWTYSELDAEGNRVANLLIAKGVQPGDLVGVCFDKCPEASFGMLGVLKAGAAFVAIDPGAPAARQTFIIRDSGAAAVLSMAAQSVQFTQDVSVPIINLDETSRATTPSTRPVLSRTITTQDRSYCLYTSGTTGTPKGCELTHENAVQALLSFQRLFAGHWDADSRWLQFASFHFDVSVLEQYWSWSVGICVVSAPRDVIFEDLASSIRTLGITHIDLTPSLAQILHPNDVPSLCKGVFITGGESLKQEILDVWGPKGVIYNGYGPTEATIGCTMYPRVPTNGKPSNIGPQFDNVGTFVFRPGTDIPVLRGGIGELCVSGKLVGKGYLNRNDLTKRSFPYLERFKERVYRTGDLVRILHDGSFDFLGRADDQVKLRGQRLEIGEINSVIRQSSQGVSDVATLVLKHPRQQKEQLVAFLVRERTTSHPQVVFGDASELTIAKDACHDKLPPYMVPTHFVPLTSMPLNINNKADVKKLKELYEGLSVASLQELANGSGGQEGSSSVQELELRKVLLEELDVSEDAVGKETSFFELGMDSISVMGVVRSAKQAGFTSATASLVMKHSTIRRLAKALSAENHRTSDRASVLAAQQAIAATQHRYRRMAARSLSVSVTDIETLAPCTPLQQGMIARSLESEDGLYFNTFLFQLSGKVNMKGLEAAWQKVQASSQILRTVFVDTEDGHLQVVLRTTTSGIGLRNIRKDETLQDCLDGVHKDWLQSNRNGFRRPFELRYLQTPEKRLLIVQIFHGLYDGISIELLFKAVWDLYSGRQSSNDAPSFQSTLAHGPLRVVDGAKTFWQKHLSGVVALLPTQFKIDSSSSPVKITRGIEALSALESTRRKLNVTAQTIAQSCWLHALQKHKKATTTTVGIVVSGRSIDFEGVDHTIGPMFNTIPYRHRPQNSEPWASIIKRVHDFNIAAHPYQHTPLRNIMKWCKIDRSQPIFDSLFVYQVTQGNEEWAKNDSWELLDGDTVADYPLAFEVEQKPGNKWSLTLIAQSHAIDRDTALKLVDDFEEALIQAITDPSMTVKTSVDLDGTENRPAGDVNGITDPINGVADFIWTHDADILRDVLVESTGSERHDITESTSIFELGLDSIDAIKLSSKLKKHNVNLPVSGIMRGLTIAKMLPYMKIANGTRQPLGSGDSELRERKRELSGYIKRQGLSPSQIEDVLPLTPLQEAMVAEMITSDFTRYYNFDVMQVTQDTDLKRLKAAWTQLVEANPILRTSFVDIDDPEIDESFAQMIHARPHRFWREVNLTCKPDFPALFDQIRREAEQAAFSEPPFHVLLVNSPGQTHLLLAIAHALYDGWSLGLLHADVKRAYHGQLKPRPHYQDTLSAILRSPDEDPSVFWENYLMDIKPSAFPRRPKPFDEQQEKLHRSERESRISAADLARFAKKSNISVQTLGQSVFSIVLASYVQSLDVTFGCVLSGRDDEIASQVLFPTMSTVVIRTILHGTYLELIRHVQDSFLKVKEWQHLPLRRALQHGGVHGGLFESLFIYQKSMDKSADDEELYTSVEGHSDVEYPVCVEMEVVSDKLIWRCAVKDEVFNEAGAKELLDRFDQVLTQILHQPDQSVIEFTPQGASVCKLPAFQTEDLDESSPGNIPKDGRRPDQEPPQPETVLAIREVLAIVADVAHEYVTDDMTIFHIGLDSISAIKVSSLLRQQKIILSVGDMLRAGSVRDMARIADARVFQYQEPSEDHVAVIQKTLQGLDHDEILRRANAEGCRIGNIDEVQLLPATAGQVYMIAMWLNTNGSNFYPTFIHTLRGNVSFKKLQESWRTLVAAIPILRTYIVATQDQRTPYMQLIRKKDEAEPSIIDLTEHATIESEMVQPWTRLHVAQTDDGWTLKLKIHHALYDGVSLPILMQQLQDICNEGSVPPPDNVFEKLVASGLKFETRESFWKSYLHGTEQSHLSQPQSTISTRSEIFVPGLLPTKSLEESSRRHGISIQALFLVTYAKMYAKLTATTNDRDVILGIYLANRSHPVPGLETAAIPTVNLLPIRVRTPLEQTTVYAARQVQKDLQRISEMANASASLYEIKKWTGVTVDTFVNFLTLPAVEETQDTKGVKIAPKSDWDEAVDRVEEHKEMFRDEDEDRIEKLRNEAVNGAYLVSYPLPDVNTSHH